MDLEISSFYTSGFQCLARPTVCTSTDWPAVQNTYPVSIGNFEEYTNEDLVEGQVSYRVGAAITRHSPHKPGHGQFAHPVLRYPSACILRSPSANRRLASLQRITIVAIPTQSTVVLW
jgi:hypothetical protein